MTFALSVVEGGEVSVALAPERGGKVKGTPRITWQAFGAAIRVSTVALCEGG